MAEITIVKTDTGTVEGFGEKNARAWARFKKAIRDMAPGEILSVSTWFPRNGGLHRMHFAMLAQLHDAQEQWEDPEQFRMWVQVGAGHCEFVPGPHGRMVAIPKSIAFAKMDDAEFQVHHEAVKAFMRSDRALSFLWPHLTPMQASEMVEAIVRPFEESRQ